METLIEQWLWSPAMKQLWLTLVVLAGIQIFVMLGKRTVTSRVRNIDARYRLRKGIQLIGFAAMVLPLALIYRERLGGLTVILGVAGAGIAFALQEVIASIAGWAAVSFGGSYVEEAELAWKDLVRKYRIENAQTDPMVLLVANDNWMEFTVRYVVNFKARRSTKNALFTALMDAVQASEGRLQLASATFQIVEAPPLQVHLASGGHLEAGHE